MQTTNKDKLFQLLSTGTKENVELAFSLAKANNIALSQNTFKILYKFIYNREMSDYELKNLHEEIKFILQKKELYLDYKDDILVPEEIEWLKNLRDLEFQNRDKTVTLSDNFATLDQIETVCFAPGRPLNIEKMIGMKNLNQLVISGLPTKQVPLILSKLPALKILAITDTGLTELPEWFGELKGLTDLALGSNNFKKFPEELLKLQNLEGLLFSINKPGLDSIPEGIGQLTKLRYLNLGFNNIQFIPESIGNLTKLKKLNISYNKLNTLPEAISKLTKLEELDFSKNPIDSIEMQRIKRIIPERMRGFKGKYTLPLTFR